MNVDASLHVLMRMGVCFWCLCLLSPLTLGAIEVPSVAYDKLKAEEFALREQAQRELLEWARAKPDVRTEALYQAYKQSDDPEQQERCLAILRELVGERFDREGEGFIGINMLEVRVKHPQEDIEIGGVQVNQVLPGFAADKHGLRAGDVIISCRGARVPDAMAAIVWLPSEVKRIAPGTEVRFEILRGERIMEIAVVLGRRPPNAELGGLQVPLEQHRKDQQRAREAYFQQWLKDRQAAEPTRSRI